MAAPVPWSVPCGWSNSICSRNCFHTARMILVQIWFFSAGYIASSPVIPSTASTTHRRRRWLMERRLLKSVRLAPGRTVVFCWTSSLLYRCQQQSPRCWQNEDISSTEKTIFSTSLFSSMGLVVQCSSTSGFQMMAIYRSKAMNDFSSFIVVSIHCFILDEVFKPGSASSCAALLFVSSTIGSRISVVKNDSKYSKGSAGSSSVMFSQGIPKESS